MIKIEVAFNPHKPAPCRYGSRRVAIDAALAVDFVPTAQEAIEAIRASKDTKHLLFQKPQKITVQVCDKMSRLAAKMYLEIISGEKNPLRYSPSARSKFGFCAQSIVALNWGFYEEL